MTDSTQRTTTESATNRIDLDAVRDEIVIAIDSLNDVWDFGIWGQRGEHPTAHDYADAVLSALADKGLRIVPDALLVACDYLITFGDKDTDLARTTHAQIETYRASGRSRDQSGMAGEEVK